MDLFRGHERNAGMAMLVVVPVKERLAERSCVLDGAKPFRELGTIFQGLELCFRVRVVIAQIGPAVGFGDPEVGKQVGDDLGLHARSPISMNGQLPRLDTCFMRFPINRLAKMSCSRCATIQPTT